MCTQVPNSIQNVGMLTPDSSNSPRSILVDEATIHGNINCAVVNKNTGMFSLDKKLSRVRLHKEDRKIGTQVITQGEAFHPAQSLVLVLSSR